MKKLIDTYQITLCERCDAVVKMLADIDGNYYCGRCKQPVKSMDEIEKHYHKRGYGISIGEENGSK